MYTIECCKKLKKLVKEDYMFSIMSHVPFDAENKHAPTLYILSDGGHGGCEKANYCPFCGQEINKNVKEK